MTGEIHDELMMLCAQCCRKHLSAAIAHYVDSRGNGEAHYYETLFARALINLCEATEGYASHFPFAIGLFVKAEEECYKPEHRNAIRGFRIEVSDGKWPCVPPEITPSEYDWYLAHVIEAEREFPEIRDVVEREPFYRNNMSERDHWQAEVNYRLAQLKWLDDNIFGLKPAEKGEEKMACKKVAPKAAAKKAACKGGCTKKGCGKKGK